MGSLIYPKNTLHCWVSKGKPGNSQNSALPAQTENKDSDCDPSFFVLPTVGHDVFTTFFSFIQGGVQWQHPAQRLQCHVSGLPWGREDIREHDIVCLSF